MFMVQIEFPGRFRKLSSRRLALQAISGSRHLVDIIGGAEQMADGFNPFRIVTWQRVLPLPSRSKVEGRMNNEE